MLTGVGYRLRTLYASKSHIAQLRRDWLTMLELRQISPFRRGDQMTAAVVRGTYQACTLASAKDTHR